MRAFLFYIEDWLGSKNVEMMDAAEERGYLRLLLHQANDDNCTLPDDDVQLAVLSKLGPQWFKPTREKEKRLGAMTSGEKLRQRFLTSSGRLINERLFREWNHQQEVREKRKAAGRLGGRPQDCKHQESNCFSSENQRETNLVSVLALDSSVREEFTEAQVNLSLSDLQDGWFDLEFWPHYWRKVDKADAKKSFKKHATSESMKNKIVRAMLAQAPQYLSRDPEHRPHASTWLNKKRYDDDLSELPTAKGQASVVPRDELRPDPACSKCSGVGQRIITSESGDEGAARCDCWARRPEPKYAHGAAR